MNNLIVKIFGALVWLTLSACTTINVDHIQLEDTIDLSSGDAVVVLGRHHSAEFETEPSLIRCLSSRLERGTENLVIIPEEEFVDQFYPWFEARTAPLHPNKLKQVLDQPQVAERIEALNIRFFVWVEGSTERTNSAGSMACSIAPGGAGCFGFGTWEDTSDYETEVWDIDELKEIARVSTDAVGTSYLPAFVVPVPLLARVESEACQGMGTQLVKFFDTNQSMGQ
ncbi:MAG: hypothetical protein KTR16_12210 [Acidiferrobacterales bacterium]|nr:hypothetical protein [Acidiferrobacterales bacterium]